jgi:hypothetical protein
MKKYVGLLITGVLTLTLAGVLFSRFTQHTLLCKPETMICLNEDGTYKIDDQSIVIAVETQNQKDWLQTQLAPYLENSNAVISIIVRESTSAFTFMNSTIDVAMFDKQAAGTLYPYLHRFDLEEVNPFFINYASQHLDEINHDGVRFIPMSIDGPLFVMNTTLLARLGFDINDVDEYGRLNELSSFEAIMEANERFRSSRPLINNRRLTSMFPLTLVEPWSLYTFFTMNGWHMYPTNDAFETGLDSAQFLEALEMMQPILSHEWDLSGSKQRQWRYEQEFINNTTPFAIKVPWLNLEAISKVTKQNYVVTIMPTINGLQPYTLAQVKGWVFKESASPALRALVMEKLTSYNFTQLLLLEDQEAVMIDAQRVNEFKMSELQKQKILASQFTLSPPLFALPHYPSVLGFDFYTDGTLIPFLNQLQNQNTSPKELQEQILQAYNRWVIERTYYENNTNP